MTDVARYSTVPEVRRQLVILLENLLSGVQVDRVHPGDAALQEGAHLGDVRGRHEPAAVRDGRQLRQESYTVDVYLETAKEGEDGSAAEERAFVLLGGLEDVMADDETLGGVLVAGWARVGDWVTSTYYDDKTGGWACTIRAEVNVQARLG